MGFTKGLVAPGPPLVPKMIGLVKVWAVENGVWLELSLAFREGTLDEALGRDEDTKAILTAAV